MRISIAVLFLLMTQMTFGQSVWKSVDEHSIANRSISDREIVPDAYSSFALDFQKMEKRLRKAQHEDFHKKAKGITLDLPLPNGQVETFIFHESRCMSPILSEKFPMIKSYRGVSVTNSYNQARVDFGTMGFHAVINSTEGRIFIDPYFSIPDEHYISYFTKDHHPDIEDRKLSCGVSNHHVQSEAERSLDIKPSEYYSKSLGTPVTKRTFRMAIATTGEWGALFGTVDNVMSRIVTGVNRLNMIYENSIAVKFELIDDNDQLIFLDGATDPYENPTLGSSLLGQNGTVINNIIGSQAYDIGHIFTVRCSDVGGVANPGVVCLGGKANGVSCVGQSNISAFMVDTGAHEVGHQFSGGHSWNNCPGILEQKSDNTAFEPGSGSTILSYAGACGSQNIKGSNDDYFHVGNLDQFLRFIETTARCAVEETSDNNTPDITLNIPENLSIPIATPFELDGSATDMDGDELTYNWEQMDTGPTSPLGSPMGNAPSFRSYPPSTETKRIFPRLPFILGGIGSNLEVLPLVSRDLTFRFTVRDNHPGAGITVWEDIELKATDTAGPFRVTSQSSVTFIEVGQSFDVEWDVANTDNDIVNCQTVDIYLSLNNGQDFDILLASDVPNDGLETIIMPNNLTNEGKIKVKASENVFFAFNRSTIVVRQPSAPGFFIDVENNQYDVCLPNQLEIPITATSFQDFDTPIDLNIIESLPEGVSFSFENNPVATDGNTTLILDLSDIKTTQSFEFTLEGTAENAPSIQQPIQINATGTDFSDLNLLSPVSGIAGLDKTPTFEWSTTANADSYTVEVSNSPSFGSSNVVTEEFLPDTSYLPGIIFDNSSLYYWRITAHNDCIDSPSEINTFGTVSLDCKSYVAENLPTNISLSGTVEVEGIARVFDTGKVADINVSNITGQHSDIIQVEGRLVSPRGTEAVLFDNTCFASTDFNVGFDSDSPLDFSCPLNSGDVIKPQVDDLSIFNGEDIDGDWILRLNDNQAGDGGQFTSFELEICASFELKNPFIVNNEVLDVPTGLSAVIRDSELLVDDEDNFSDELTYTLVVLPLEGILTLNGEELNIGDTFTQEELNNESVRYIHQGDEETTDAFTFTVIDGQGGWIGLTNFDINIANDIQSSVEDLLESNRFEIYPNPTSDILLIRDVSNSISDWNIEVYSIDGRLQLKNVMNNEIRLSMANLSEGIYILKIANQEGSLSKRVSVVK